MLVHRGTHSLHNLDICSEALQHIAASFHASLIGFSVAEWPTVARCFAPRWPHDRLVLQLVSYYPSGLFPAAGLPTTLQPHHAPCFSGACRRLPQEACGVF